MTRFSRDHVLPRIGRIEQLAEVRRTVLDDGKGRGMRVWEVRNASGLEFAVYPDKGLDIGPATFDGLPIAWTSRNGAVAPSFYDKTGVEWLRTWAGGLLTSCGWTNAGVPCGEEGLHGRHDNTPAEEVNSRGFWNECGEYVLEISGKIVHSRVFAENLVTRRTIRTVMGRAAIALVDETENVGTKPSPLMQLYHMNFGWPLVGEDAVLEAPVHPVTPQNPYCAEHLSDWDRFAAPQPNFAEQVFYHDLQAGADGFASVQLRNPTAGLWMTLSFLKDSLPYLIQWKMPGTGEYVLGLEPSNCYPEGHDRNAERGILRTIGPGESIRTEINLEIGKI